MHRNAWEGPDRGVRGEGLEVQWVNFSSFSSSLPAPSLRDSLIGSNLKALSPPPNAGVTGTCHHTWDTFSKSFTARVPHKRAPCEKDSDTDADHNIYTPPPSPG